MGYKKIKDEAFGKFCRQCINDTYRKKLKTEDCLYFDYPGKCSKCGGGVKNIVKGVRIGGFIKLLL